MDILYTVLFVIAFPAIGVVLGFFLRWKLLLIATTVLPAGFIWFMLGRVGETSHEGFYAVVGGAVVLSLLFCVSAWITRALCRFIERRRQIKASRV